MKIIYENNIVSFNKLSDLVNLDRSYVYRSVRKLHDLNLVVVNDFYDPFTNTSTRLIACNENVYANYVIKQIRNYLVTSLEKILMYKLILFHFQKLKLLRIT